MRYFDRLHPAAALLYFVLAALLPMLTGNPLVILASYLASLAFTGLLIGPRALAKSLAYSLPTALIIAVTNPIFVHRGKTVLFFLNDNPVTREAILYGVFAALGIMSVFYWCKCYSEIVTADKLVYLFGRITPKLALLLAMALAFIPRLRRRYREIDEAQRGLGIYATEGLTDRLRAKLRTLSILITCSLEGSIETADSMKSRGYGLAGRTSAERYRLSSGDAVFLSLTLLAGGATVALMLFGAAEFSFYPALSPIRLDTPACLFYGAVALLLALSALSEVKENILWRILRSKI